MESEGDSLPSTSVFVRHVESVAHHDLKGDSGVIRADIVEDVQGDRENLENIPLKPMKPPPPVRNSFDEQLVQSSYAKKASAPPASNRRSREEVKQKPVVKHAFLKRGSRKEPSALNRIKKQGIKPSEGNSAQAAPGGLARRSVDKSALPAAGPGSKRSVTRGHGRHNSSVPVDILVPERPAVVQKREPEPELEPEPQERPSPRNTMPVWEPVEQSRALKELEEFEALEQQLEAIEDHPVISSMPVPHVRAQQTWGEDSVDEVVEYDDETHHHAQVKVHTSDMNEKTVVDYDSESWERDNFNVNPSLPAVMDRRGSQPSSRGVMERQQLTQKPLIVESMASRKSSQWTTSDSFEKISSSTAAQEEAASLKARAMDEVEVLRRGLASKALELEEEIATYKRENTNIKQLRKQQEATLAEALSERRDIMAWVEEEKERTEVWCKEQKQAAVRQRRNASNLFKDAQKKEATAVPPNRKERAEMTALQATIEKLKVDCEGAKKKFAVAERRMQQRIRDQAETIKAQKERIQVLEDEKSRTEEVLNRSPAGRGIIRMLQSGHSTSKANMSKALVASSTTSGGQGAPISAEEFYFLSEIDKVAALSNAGGHTKEFQGEEEESYSRGSLSNAIFENSSSNNMMSVGMGKLGPSVAQRSSLRYNSMSKEYSDTDEEPISVNTAGNRHADGAEASASFDSGHIFTRSMESDGDNSGTGERQRTEEITTDGRRIVTYRNQTIKETLRDGNTVVRYTNGDTMTTDTVSGAVVYYYAQAKTTHTTLPDGTNIYEFPNKQIEEHFPDGSKHIYFPDSTKKVVLPDGTTESTFPDGVCIREDGTGNSEVVEY